MGFDVLGQLQTMWRRLGHRDRMARELDDEVRAAYDLLVTEKLRAGRPPAEALRSAALDLGGIEQVKEEVRSARRGAQLEGVLRTFHYALRRVLRQPRFAVLAVFTLALGMAGATLMFTLLRGIVLRPLPVQDEARLVVSWRVPPTGAATHIPYRASDVEHLARESKTLEAVTGVAYNGAFELTWNDRGRVFSARTAPVMGDFFRVVGVAPLLGSSLTREHDRSGAEKSLVLSFGAWQRLFGGAQDIVGRSLVSRKQSFVIVGVMPADFEYPRGVEMWTTPTAMADGEPNMDYRTALLRDVELVARLRPGVAVEQARGELTTIVTRLDAQQTVESFLNFRPVVQGYKDVVVGDIRRALVLLFAAAGLLLAIAAVSVTNLLLMRGEARRSELAVRAALGASPGKLLTELVAESMALALLAGGVGLVVSQWSLRIVTTLVPDGLPRLDAIRIDGLVIAFTVGVSFLTAAFAGLAPALAASRVDLMSRLRAGGRGSAGAASGRWRRLFVATQVALAVTVVAAAGLLGRSLQRLQGVDMGLAADRLVFAELDPPHDWSAYPHRLRQVLDAVTERIAAVPEVEAVTPLNVQPFAGVTGWDLPRFTAEGQTPDQVAGNSALNFEAVHVPYFSTLGITIMRGRVFTTADRDGAPHVAIVSDALADVTWPGQDPIGKRVKFGGLESANEWLTVVGVVGTTRYRELATPRPTLYIPAAQFPSLNPRLAIRTSADTAHISRVVAESVRAVDPNVGVMSVASFNDYLRVPLAGPRFNTLLLVIFGGAALLLSTIGLYGVMAVSVRQRHAEIGVRLALGATAGHVRRLVIAEGLQLALVGAIAGLVPAWAATRLLQGQLFEVEPLDLVSLLGAVIALVGAAVLATYLPARRAAGVNPTALLRAD